MPAVPAAGSRRLSESIFCRREHYNYFRDYDPALGRYFESDPIALAGGLNTYGYVGSSPLRHSDSEGTDYWIENAASTEQQCPEQGCGMHQSFCVGKPLGKRYCQSFGRLGNQGWCFRDCVGTVYQDKSPPGPIEPGSYRLSSSATDKSIMEWIGGELNAAGRYDLLPGFPGLNCRTYSQGLFDRIDRKFKGTSSPGAR